MLAGFGAPPIASRWWATAGGVRFYDDSKATTPHATLAAVRSFASVVLIAGGRNKGLDLSVLAGAADHVRAVVAIGEAAAEVEAAFAGKRPSYGGRPWTTPSRGPRRRRAGRRRPAVAGLRLVRLVPVLRRAGRRLRDARHFARIPRERCNDDMVSVEEWLSLDPAAAEGRVPHVLVVDDSDSLHRLIVDAKLMQGARRCLEMWHGLQEFAHLGVRNGAPVVDGTGRRNGDRSSRRPRRRNRRAGRGAGREPSEQVAEEQELTSDEPWIETPRCSTCNECTAINDRMFAYNENKQAFLKDPDAGTFRELVEAAEACQVAIIHPGQPRNPNELGLEELIERALPFQ